MTTSPELLEPYGLRLTVCGRQEDPAAFACGLLDDIAERAEAAGASLIGHLKCRALAPSGTFYCNLTSRRSGARCRTVPAVPVPGDEATEIDLTVLVYGLEWAVVDSIVREGLEARRAGGLQIKIRAPDGGSGR